MARVDADGAAFKGSQFQFQNYVNRHRSEIDAELKAIIQDHEIEIEWRSPLATDGYREYQDQSFLLRLNLSEHISELKSFWPRGGPVWDGLALAHGTTGTRCLLFEAKSHLPELESQCAASPKSRTKIAAALDLAREELMCTSTSDWLSPYYQYANRLAHFLWLRSRVPTYLVNVYFVDDPYKPTSATQWHDGLKAMKEQLGLSKQIPGTFELFLPAKAYS
jgi:hypothetical protein